MKEHYDVIIVGTGAAGLYCALNLPEKMKILLITKQEADQSDSFLAQGGICMLRGEDDYENYLDTTRIISLILGTLGIILLFTYSPFLYGNCILFCEKFR